MSPTKVETPVLNDLSLPQDQPESIVTAAQQPHNQLFSLAGRTIVVTGGGRGLGICLAMAVVEAGGHVACIDVLAQPDESEWPRLQKTALKQKLTATYHKCDITDEATLSEVLRGIATSVPDAPLRGVIACAGVQQLAPALDYPMADFERIMRINVTGTFLTVKHVAKIMVESKIQGSIVMIASMSGQIANRVCILYCNDYCNC